MKNERQNRFEELKQEGDVAFEAQRYKNALQCYSDALEINKEDASLYSQKALVNIILRNYDEVIIDSNKAIKIDPLITQAHCSKATALYNQLAGTETAKTYKVIDAIQAGLKTVISLSKSH